MSLDAELQDLPDPDECPTPTKRHYRSRAAARRYQRRLARVADGQHKARLYPYQCPAGDHWHLTHQTPDEQKRVAAWIAKTTAPTTSTPDATMSHQHSEPL